MPLAPGTRLGPYEILAPLGAGGMGEVWRARDPRLGRDVAIKALPPNFAQDPERLARFEREARLLASLSHPNIAGIFGLEEVDGARYLVLELVAGETLAQRLARGPLPFEEALDVARQVAAGVEAAHENGVVHRDLKPGNVMLTPTGAVKVLDFGLAKAGAAERAGSDPALSASPTLTYAATEAGVILGTAAYMSPEQARGRAVDKRTDIWSFGCVLFECLSGGPAFAGETVTDLLAHILKSEPDWAALPASLPPYVRALLERCLEKDARARLRDIGEARIALTSPPPAAAPAPAPIPHRGVSLAGALVAALVVGALAALATLRFGHGAQGGPVRRLDVVAADVLAEWPIVPQLSPDGAHVAYVSATHLWVRDLDQLAPRSVADLEAPGPLAWSPDAKSLVYGDQGRLWVVPAQGGAPTALCAIPATGRIVGASWSAKGKIAFAVWRDRIYQVDAAGGTPTILVDLDPATQIDFHCPEWLPDGELLYVTHWKEGRDPGGKARSRLAIFDGKSAVPVAGEFGDSPDNAPLYTAGGRLLYLRTGASPGVWSVPFDLARRRATGPARLVGPDGVTISASNDGSILYAVGSDADAPREMVWIDRAGKIVGVAGKPHVGLDRSRISPDGNRVTFQATEGTRGDVWVLDLGRGTETRLTFGQASSLAPEWLGATGRIAYMELQPDGMRGSVVSTRADGSGGRLEISPPAYITTLNNLTTMTSDGTMALRIVDERGSSRLRVGRVLPDGTVGPLAPLLHDAPEPSVVDATLSPDGKLLAYVTAHLGQNDVFLTRFPSGEGQWQVGGAGGRAPRWARGSGELFFLAGNGFAQRTLAVARVDASQNPPLGAITSLFGGALARSDFDVMPDGSRILSTRPAGGANPSAPRLVLVQNWERALEQGTGPR